MPIAIADMRWGIFASRARLITVANACSRMRKSLSVISVSFQKKLWRPCTHSKYETITPPALQRMSGMTNISSQRWKRITSASGVVGPFAASARMRHWSRPALRG